MNVPRETRRCRVARSVIDADAARRIFQQLVDEGVSVDLVVPFLIHARGWRIQAFCEDVGVHRAYLHALLRGRYTASVGLRLAVRRRLGFDPWQGRVDDNRPHEPERIPSGLLSNSASVAVAWR
jgi:hypothetical protein